MCTLLYGEAIFNKIRKIRKKYLFFSRVSAGCYMVGVAWKK